MPNNEKKRTNSLIALSALSILTLASCASSTAPVADTNRDGILSDREMTQFRRQQEVRGVRPGSGGTTATSKTIRGVRAAREVAGTANTFYWLTRWL